MESISSGRPEAHVAATTYLQDHLAEYLTYLSDKGSAPKYVRQVGNQVRKLLECAKIAEVRHLMNPGPIQLCISKLPAQGLSSTTINSYVRHSSPSPNICIQWATPLLTTAPPSKVSSKW